MAAPDEFTGPTTELLQALIRNACVNDGTPDSGEETRNSDLLVGFLEGAGLDVQRFTPRHGRDSMVARIEGSDPDAPSLCLMGHTDVVPVNADGWRHDPFGGEVIDGAWLITLRDKGLAPDDLHWRFLDPSGTVLASGTGVFPPEA